MRSIFSGSMRTAYLTLVIHLTVLPSVSIGSEEFYTIQLGSFIRPETADTVFDSLLRRFDNKDLLGYLRVEKVKNYYTVRLGMFDDPRAAKDLLRKVKPHFPGAILLKAFVKDERIIRMFGKAAIEKEGVVSGYDERGKNETAGSPGELIETVSELVERGDLHRAIDLIKSGLLKWPESPDLHGWYGATLLKLDLPGEAIKYFTRAVELSPATADYHNGLGYSLLYMDRLDEAMVEFNRALEIDPGHADALSGLGVAYVALDRKDLAVDVYTRLKDVDRDAADMLFEMIMRR